MITLLIIFISGIIIGSFLNVCIYRIPENESILFPWSHCPNCKTQIKPYDNIPIISFFILNGKCRTCQKNISLRYPLVELTTGIIFSLFYYRFGFTIDFIPGIIFISSLIVITFIDIEYNIIPNIITLPLIIFFNFFGLYKYLVNNDIYLLIDPFTGLIIGGVILYIIAWISKGGMGGGDIKLAALIGSALGLKKVLITLFLAFIIGGIFGAVLIITGKKNKKDKIAFAPFICLGSIITLIWGKEIIVWYLNNILLH